LLSAKRQILLPRTRVQVLVGMENLNLKKIFLYLLIASVSLSAVLGIAVILLGDFGEFETKVLLTTLTVTVTSILGLACGAYLETERGKLLPVIGIVFSIVAAIFWIFLIWFEPREDFFAKLLLSVTMFAASCSLLSLISIAQLDGRFIWSRYIAHAAVWTSNAIVIPLIWMNFKDVPELISRTLGVLAIVIAGLTVVTPVFHKLSNQEHGTEQIDAEIARLKLQIEELEKRRTESSARIANPSD